jgi:predicted esterase
MIHRFEPGASPALLLLHGTGGDENDLLGLGRTLRPGAALLSPRGEVLENGMPRFFRRLAPGVFDEHDLVRRADALAAFVGDRMREHRITSIIAAGYSNGANIAAALLLLHPGLLAGAVLLRAMVPLRPPVLPPLAGVPVLLSAGREDPMIPAEGAGELAALLGEAGADLTVEWQDTGHNLNRSEIDRARAWLGEKFPGAAS